MQLPPARKPLSIPHAVAFAAVFALIAWIVIRSLPTAHHEPDSDEGYYLHFADQVQRHGLGIFPSLFETWNKNEIVAPLVLAGPSWYHPPPYRVGYIVPCALWGGLFGTSIESLSWLSAVSHLVWVLLNWWFARRHLGESVALALATLCAFSTLLAGESRLALMDNYTLVWATAAAWMFLEMLEQPRAWSWQLGFALSFTMSILTKELSVFLAPPLVLVVLVERFVRKRPLPLWRFAAVFASPALVVVPAFVLAAGGFGTLMKTVEVVLSVPGTMEYAIELCSGPWYRYLIDYFCLSPFPTLLGLLGFGAFLHRLMRGEWSTPEFLFSVLGVGLLAEQAPFIKNARYMMTLELPLRLLGVSLLFRCTQRLRPLPRGLVLGGAIAGLCLMEWQSFEYLFIEKGTYDPVSYGLLRERRIIPWR